MRITQVVSFGLILLALAGCGDDGEGSGGGSVTTGLPEDKMLADVTAAEAQDVCESLAASSANAISEADLARLPCTIAALSSPANLMSDGMGGVTVDRAACEESVSSCLEAAPEPAPSDDCDAGTLMASLADCDATAAELEACLNASLPQIRSLLAQINCNVDLNAGPPSGFEEPAACKALDMKCPGVLDAVGGVALPDVDLGDDGDDTSDAGVP